MNVYVDESFISGETTIVAIYISEEKISAANKEIRRTLSKKNKFIKNQN